MSELQSEQPEPSSSQTPPNVFNTEAPMQDSATGSIGRFLGFEERNSIKYARYKFDGYDDVGEYESLIPTGLASKRIKEYVPVFPPDEPEHKLSPDFGAAPAAIRAHIIDDVLSIRGVRSQDALKQSDRTFVSSVDNRNAVIFAIQLDPGSSEEEIDLILTENGSESIFPVLAERESDVSDPSDKEIAERERGSFIMIIPLDSFQDTSLRNMFYTYSRARVGSVKAKDLSLPIVQITTQIDAGQISHAILPQDIFQEWQEYGQHRGDFKGKVVSATYVGISESEPQGIYPDYRKALYKIAQEISSPVLVHGVKLPTDQEVLGAGEGEMSAEGGEQASEEQPQE